MLYSLEVSWAAYSIRVSHGCQAWYCTRHKLTHCTIAVMARHTQTKTCTVTDLSTGQALPIALANLIQFLTVSSLASHTVVSSLTKRGYRSQQLQLANAKIHVPASSLHTQPPAGVLTRNRPGGSVYHRMATVQQSEIWDALSPHAVQISAPVQLSDLEFQGSLRTGLLSVPSPSMAYTQVSTPQSLSVPATAVWQAEQMSA